MARKGLPKSIIKKYGISKKAWAVYRGSKSRRVTKTKKKHNPKRRVRQIARKKRRRGGKSMTRTAFKLVRLGALAAPAIYRATGPGNIQGKVEEALCDYTGFYRGKFYPHRLMMGWGPYLGAVLATFGIPKISGILRKL